MPNKGVHQRLAELKRRQEALTHSVWEHLAETDKDALISMVDKTGGNRALLNDEAWMVVELTPQEIAARNRYVDLWNQIVKR
jgi:hypothetical protein